MKKVLLSGLLFCCTKLACAQREGPELVLPSGHLDTITTLAYSKDGKYILSGSKDLTARSWEALTGKELKVFRGATSPITVIQFSPDGTNFIAGCEDGNILLWNYTSEQLLKKMRVHSGKVTAIDFYSNTKFLSGSLDRSAKIWDLTQNRATTTVYEKKYTIHSVAFYPGGDFFMTGGGDLPHSTQRELEDLSAKFWDLKGNNIKKFKNGWLSGTDDVNMVAFSTDGQYAFAGYRYGGRIFDMTNEKSKPKEKIKGNISYGSLGPLGKTILLGDENGFAVHDFPAGTLLRSFKGLPEDITSAVFSPDGNYIAYSTGSRVAFIIDALSGERLSRLAGRSGGVLSVTFSPYGKYLATGSMDATTKIWDIETGSLVKVLKGHNYPVSSLAFSSNNKNIVSGSLGNTAILYDINSGQAKYRFTGGSGVVKFSADGKQLLTMNKPTGMQSGMYVTSRQSSIYLYDTEAGKFLQEFSKITFLGNGQGRMNTCAVFSPDGKYLYVGGREFFPMKNNPKTMLSFGEIHIWDISTGKFLKTLPETHNHVISAMDISPDGKTLVTGNYENSVWFWNRMLGRKTKGYKVHEDGISSVCFSSDGKYILTASLDKTASLMEVESAIKIATFSGHTAKLLGAAFSPDNKYVVTGSWDNTTRLWNAATGRELATLIPIDMEEWLIITPEGYFDGSDKALKTLYYAYKGFTFPLEQLKPKYYKKGLLPILLGYAPGQVPDTKPFSVSDFYPQVAVNNSINPKNPILNVQLNNLGGGIGIVKVLINGKEAFPDARTLVQDKKELTADIVRIPIQLSNNKLIIWGQKNLIEIIGYNGDNSLAAPINAISFDAPRQIK